MNRNVCSDCIFHRPKTLEEKEPCKTCRFCDHCEKLHDRYEYNLGKRDELRMLCTACPTRKVPQWVAELF
jgi:hypothetical protein